MVVYKRVYNKLYIFRALKESESSTCPGLGVECLKLSILWMGNSEKSILEEGFGGCLIVVNVHDCGEVWWRRVMESGDGVE